MGVFDNRTLASCLLFLLGALQHASATPPSSGQIAVTPNNLNSTISPATNELVTIGIPIPGCVLVDAKQFRLLDDKGQEVKVFVKPTLSWPATRSPCLANSVRALKVQFTFDATQGVKMYSWDLAGRNTAQDAVEAPVSEVVTNNTRKGNFKEPRVFGILDPAYLVKTGIISASSPVSLDVYDTGYLPTLWEDTSLDLNYNTSGVTDWIYDRVSTNYKQAIRRSELKYYREAYLSHEWYIAKMEVTGKNTTVTDYCLGGFDFDGKADTFGSGGGGCDTKYIYPQAYKLHLALTGDDSWQPSENGVPSSKMDTRSKAFNTIAHMLVSGDVRGGSVLNTPGIPAVGFIKPYNSVSAPFTERDLGFGLQAVINVCELTLDTTVCGWADTIIDNVREMQTANPDGIKQYGYLSHSLRLHEDNNYLPWIGSLKEGYSGATTITVENVFGDDYLRLTTGKTIRIGSNTNAKLASNAVNNGNRTWTLNLATPVSGAGGAPVTVVYLSNGSTVDLDHPTDRMFSPWMQAITADAVWQYFNWTDNSARKEKAASILLGFARAWTAYAVDGSQLASATKTLIEQAFTDFGPIKIFSAAHKPGPCVNVTRAPYTGYFANALMSSPENNQPYVTFITERGGYNHDHIPEGYFQLSLGLLFETDAAKKAAMTAVLADLHEWFEKYECTANLGDNRAYSWSNRLDPMGTYNYVTHLVASATAPLDPLIQSIAGKGPLSAIVVASNKSVSTAAFQMGASRDTGTSVETTFTAGDSVTIAGLVKPQLIDIGADGEIFIVLRTTTATGDSWAYRDKNGVFKPWNGNIPTLEMAYDVNELKLSEAFQIYMGKLAPATHRVFIGYRRNGSNILHYTGAALVLQVN